MTTLNSSVLMTDLDTNDVLHNSGLEYGLQFNKAFNAYNKKAGDLATIVKAVVKESAGNPQNFAHIAKAFATKISRANWNNVATFFRTTAKKEGYTVSMTCDRDKDNKKANLIKASFEKTLEKTDEQKASDKKESDKAATKATKQVKQDIIADYEASHEGTVSYPATQVAILELMERLLADSSKNTQQQLLVMVGTSLENIEKAPTVEQEIESEIAKAA